MARPNRGPRLERSRTGVYEIRWSEQGRSHRKSTRTTDLAIAKQLLGRHLADEKQKVDRPFTVEEAWDLRRVEHVEPRLADPGRVQSCWNNLLPFFGAYLVTSISARDVLRYQRQREALGRSPSTIRMELGELQITVNHLVKTRRLAPGDAPKIALPPPSPPRQRWLTEQEIDALLLTAATRRRKDGRLARVERFVWLAVTTGARKRSIETLTWAQVDFERGLIDYGAKGARGSSKRRAVVPIAASLRPVLEQAHRERTGPHVLDHSGAVRKSFEALVAELGWADVSPHTLRHTFASHAAMRGVPLVDIARALGNSVAMVEKVYGKWAPEYLRNVVDAVPVTRGAGVTPQLRVISSGKN